MTEFISNAWYVAAWSDEVGEAPCKADILGEPILLYRKRDGKVVALHDTCPHRFAPLHRGKVCGDRIQCGYHGLEFDETGRCVHNPVGKGTIPAAVRIRAYPAVERNRLIWIWPGDPAAADVAAIPDFHWLDRTDEYVMTGTHRLTMEVDYRLIVDNLLDLTHGTFLHPTTLGSEALAKGTDSVEQVGDRIHYNRWNPGGEVAQLFVVSGAAKPGDIVDFWNNMRWDPPGAFYLEVGITGPGAPREEGSFLGSVHILTPESATSTVYRWLLFRNFSKEDDGVTKGIENIVEFAFTHEDEPMLRAVQDRMDNKDFWDLKPLLLPSDKAAVLARRTLDRLSAQEATPASAAIASALVE